jgi:hypothetical protein
MVCNGECGIMARYRVAPCSTSAPSIYRQFLSGAFVVATTALHTCSSFAPVLLGRRCAYRIQRLVPGDISPRMATAAVATTTPILLVATRTPSIPLRCDAFGVAHSCCPTFECWCRRSFSIKQYNASPFSACTYRFLHKCSLLAVGSSLGGCSSFHCLVLVGMAT